MVAHDIGRLVDACMPVAGRVKEAAAGALVGGLDTLLRFSCMMMTTCWILWMPIGVAASGRACRVIVPLTSESKPTRAVSIVRLGIPTNLSHSIMNMVSPAMDRAWA
jgi:hypothetical protein